jgi:TonB family protein
MGSSNLGQLWAMRAGDVRRTLSRETAAASFVSAIKESGFPPCRLARLQAGPPARVHLDYRIRAAKSSDRWRSREFAILTLMTVALLPVLSPAAFALDTPPPENSAALFREPPLIIAQTQLANPPRPESASKPAAPVSPAARRTSAAKTDAAQNAPKIGAACPNATATMSAIPYPAEALRNGITGSFIVEFVVGADGSVQRPVVIGKGDPLLADAALAAVKNFKCIGQGREIKVRAPFSFKLQNSGLPESVDVGDGLRAQGDAAGALASYRKGLANAQAAAARDAGNAGAQYEMLIDSQRIGDLLLAARDLSGALDAYGNALAVAEAMVARTPDNAEWLRHVFVGLLRIGDVLRVGGDPAGALAAYRNATSVAESLASRDSDNLQRQSDLAVSDERLGDVLSAQGDLAGALVTYRKSLALDDILATRAPDNVPMQLTLSSLCGKLGVLGALPAAERRAYLERGRDIMSRLSSQGHLPPQQDSRSAFETQIRMLSSE